MTTCVIGGGAAGLVASLTAAQKGNNVILLEKNEKLGKKIYITGKGRCNLTNYVDVNEFLQNVVTNPKFLYGALNSFSPKNAFDFFVENGLKLKVERGNRVFPESDKSSDVIRCLEKLLVNNSVDIRLNTSVLSVDRFDDTFVVITEKGKILCDSLIVCTGGVSYPLTGSTGDGYNFAKNFGHNIKPLKPSLTGFDLLGNDFKPLQGLSLKNVSITIKQKDKVLYNDFGEMLFTHFGVSGPIILSASCLINKCDFNNMKLFIDLKPALSIDVLNQRLIREFSSNTQKNVGNVLRTVVPKTLVDVVLSSAGVDFYTSCSTITKAQRMALVSSLKNLCFDIKGLRPIDEAIVTSGGIDVKEINPKTMESKLVSNLFFAGEVIDVDAFTGGFNLQIAFSTGYLAGLNAWKNII